MSEFPKKLALKIALKIIRNPRGRVVAKHGFLVCCLIFVMTFFMPDLKFDSAVFNWAFVFLTLTIANFCCYLEAVYTYDPMAAKSLVTS